MLRETTAANISGVERNVFAPLPGSATDAPHHLRVTLLAAGRSFNRKELSLLLLRCHFCQTVSASGFG